jgi:hypothetical protein
MKAPSHYDVAVRNARDVPMLRATLLGGWAEGELFWNQALRMMLVQRHARTLPYLPHFDRTALSRASLWYATTDMSRLIDHAAQTLPETTLNDDLMPSGGSTWGMVVFADAMKGSDANTGEPIHVNALVWGITDVYENAVTVVRGLEDELGHAGRGACKRALTIAMYGRLTADEALALDPNPLAKWPGRRVAAINQASDRGKPWVPLGRTDWVWGDDTAAMTVDTFDQRHRASMEEDRRWLASMFLLAAQPRVTSTSTAQPAKAKRRRAERSSRHARQLGDVVRLIDVRRPEGVPREPRTNGARAPLSYRFIVGEGTGGFWRQQACGTGWAEHRPVWIEPFVKGPADKPLRLREDVHVLRADKP